jgi:hypothetical protein
MAGAFLVGPMELLRMIKGRVVPTRAAIKRLAKELDFDVRHLESRPIELGTALAA